MKVRIGVRRFVVLLAALLVPLWWVRSALAQESARAGVGSASEVQVVFQTGHASSIGAVALSADGRLIASQAWDQTVRLWDVARSRRLIGAAKSRVFPSSMASLSRSR